MTETTRMSTVTLRKDAVGLFGIVFFVVATNGPLTALVGRVPGSSVIGCE